MEVIRIIIFILLSNLSILEADRVVMTNTGPIQGITVSTGELQIEAFLGIPYAEPPIGRLRFKEPVAKTPWSGVYDASRKPYACVQNASDHYYEADVKNMTEDCLYLSLWVPYSKKPTTLKTVILFTHGGAFNLGSGSMKLYDGTNIARFGDVIVGNMNYRVGALGFFSTLTEDLPGNMGVFDQIMAVKWVKANAKAFGGNPENLVLMGESAGGLITGASLTAPMMKGLFKRVIMQSGSPLSAFSLDNNKLLYDSSVRFTKITGCANKTRSLKSHPKMIVRCLQSLPAQELANAEGIMKNNNPITFIPRTGRRYMPKPVIHLIKDGTSMDAEMLIGLNELEGSLFLTVAAAEYFGEYGQNRTNRISKRLAFQIIRMIFRAVGQENEKEIAEQYLNNLEDASADEIIEAIATSMGDFLMSCQTYYHAELHSIRNPVYFYLFTRRASSTPNAEWMKATHFDELQYIFGNPLFQNFTPEEAAFSERVMARWIAFAKTGNPNLPGLIEWPQFKYNDPKYLELNDVERIGSRPDDYRCEFWRERHHAVLNDEIVARLKEIRSNGMSITFNVLPIIISLLSIFLFFHKAF